MTKALTKTNAHKIHAGDYVKFLNTLKERIRTAVRMHSKMAVIVLRMFIENCFSVWYLSMSKRISIDG